MSELPWSLWKSLDARLLSQDQLKSLGVILTPDNDFSEALFRDHYRFDETLRTKFYKSRSVPHHRLYFVVLHEVVEATGLWSTIEDLHTSIKFHLRMVKEILMITPKGSPPITKFITQSISFSDMDQAAFRIFFKRAMLAIEESTGIDTDALIDAAKAKTGYELPWRRE